MQKARWIKILTLSSFLLFITTFILYRSGQLDAWFESEALAIQTSHNGGSIADNAIDTTKPTAPDTTKRLLMSSSKSIVLAEPPKRYKDTVAQKKKIDSIRRRMIMMSSSKSGIIFTPDTSKSNHGDTIKYRKQKQ